MSNTLQVVSEIVEHDICCGCGICAGACPFKNLKMVWRDNGDLAPELLGQCAKGCRLCLKVCPFGPSANSEDWLAHARFDSQSGIKHDKVAGYYLGSFAGYSIIDSHRERGSSGGMASWLSERLLTKNLVDAVVCVGGGTSGERLFEYQIYTEVNSLRTTSGSRYYPADLGETISFINNEKNDVRYAVVGLPCALKGLRLAMEALPRLRRRIVYILGLTCGHMPNRYYTEFLACLSGIDPNLLASVQYRDKEGTGNAANYKFRAVDKAGLSGVAVSFNKISNFWVDGYFQVNACNFCEDVFAEVADICFMDAWLPEYVRDPLGHSLLVVRSPMLLELLREGAAYGDCHLEPLPINKVFESQQGVIEKKVRMLGARLHGAALLGFKTPAKRTTPEPEAYKRHRRQIEALFATQQFSKNQWRMIGISRPFLFRFCLFWLSLPLKLERLIARIRRVFKQPSLLLRLVWR